MIPALIDLHVKPVLNEQGQQDVELLAVQARDHGLDGVVVLGRDEPVDLGETGAISDATGIQFFAGVEIDTEIGGLLCYPRVLDDWFRKAGWRELAHANGAGPAYHASDIVRAFSERGGAVVAAGGNQDALRQAGIAGVVVTGADPQARVDDSVVQAAQAARLACVGGSAAEPGQERFGAVATLFAAPPTSQQGMVDGLRSGRVWPAEIGAAEAVRVAATPPQRKREDGNGLDEHGGGSRPAGMRGGAGGAADQELAAGSGQAGAPFAGAGPGQGGVQPAGARGRQDSRERDKPRPDKAPAVAQSKKPVGRLVDPFERPGDNRGNRLNREEVRRQVAPLLDDTQPAFDPMAAMYGLDGRKVLRFANKTDAELDRINGNRAKGPDPNVMAHPAFDDMRAERQGVSLLFAIASDDDDRADDSVAMRFALSHFKQSPGGLPPREPQQQQARRGGGRPNENKRRRR